MISKQNFKSQDGLVSIIIVTIIIVILSLMSIGFTRIMNRELRQSLDRELSSQANYAAESGMNDARAFLEDKVKNNAIDDPGVDSGGKCKPKTELTPTFFAKEGNISGDHKGDGIDDLVKYTCVIIETKPNTLTYTPKAGESKVFKVTSAGGAIDQLYFGWQNQNLGNGSVPAPLPGVPGASAAYNLPQEGAFLTQPDATGMLRISVYPVKNGDNGNALVGAARTYFLYSNQSGAPGNVAGATYASQNGVFIDGNCNIQNRINTGYLPFAQGGRYCNSKVRSLTASNADFYYVRVTALYTDLDVSVQASDTSNNTVKIAHAQAVIDVTAEGNDVLKRLQGRVAISDVPKDSEIFTTQSIETLCKRIRLPKTGPNSYGTAYNDDSSPGGDDACNSDKIIVTPPPPPPPPPPANPGDADIDSGCTQNCNTAPAGGSYVYDNALHNLSVNNSATVSGCLWEFGDGVTLSNVACNYDDWTPTHTWPRANPELAYPGSCYTDRYTSKLTMYFTNGTSKSDSYVFAMPLCK